MNLVQLLLTASVPTAIATSATAQQSEGKRVEEECEGLRQLETALIDKNSVSMMGELAALLAHEIRQPIAAAIMDASACMHWLHRDPPDVTEARGAASRMVAAATRAAVIIGRVGSLTREASRNGKLPT